jgi:hypothetical protein
VGFGGVAPNQVKKGVERPSLGCCTYPIPHPSSPLKGELNEIFLNPGYFMTQQNSVRTNAPALEKIYQFMLWLVPTVDKMPRSQKFTLGDRIQNTALDALDNLIEATYTKSAEAQLRQVNLDLEKLRFLFRMAADLRLIDLGRYEFSAKAINDVGRLVGGWMKTQRT